MNVLKNFNHNLPVTKFGAIAFTFVVSVALFTGCNEKRDVVEKPMISVSILPQKYFVEKIAGNKFNINVLIPSGASPETYEPTPSQIIKLEKSDIYFEMGYIEMEVNRMRNYLKNKPGINVINCSEGINLITGKNKWVEPHIWLSPKNVKIIARNIFNGLSDADRSNQALYQNNLNSFLKQIDSLDNVIRTKLSKIKTKSFLIYHPALTYFAKDYGLNQIPVETEGKAPSSKYMKTIIEKAKRENIKTVVVQQQFDIEKAKTIAKEINARVVTINPLNYNWAEEMISIADKLSEFE